ESAAIALPPTPAGNSRYFSDQTAYLLRRHHPCLDEEECRTTPPRCQFCCPAYNPSPPQSKAPEASEVAKFTEQTVLMGVFSSWTRGCQRGRKPLGAGCRHSAIITTLQQI